MTRYWTRITLSLTLIRLLLAFVPLPLAAQTENGEIVGTVRDSTGAVVAGVLVKARNLDTNLEREVASDQGGNYAFPALYIGRYEVSASLEGFKTATATNNELQVNNRLRIDLVLAPGAVTEVIEVTSTAALLETDTSSRGQVIGGNAIRELPLNKRDYTELALLVPGTTREPRHRLGGAMNINGNRALQNNFLLDGADNNSNATSYRGERVDVIRPSVDAVAEFKLMTNSYSAEFGRSAGAVVNVAIKSGTNEFHGGAWEFFRNDRLDAHGWTPTVPEDLKRKLRYNLYGANIGGPIVKDKAFFFFNYEGERERNGQTYITAVPTDFLRQGDFSDLAGAPSQARTVPLDPTTGEPFANALIPRSLWDPVTIRVIDHETFPEPTSAGFSNNFNATRTDRIRSDKFDARADYQINDNWRLFGRYSFADLERFRPTVFEGLAEGSTNDAFGTTATRGQNAVMGPTITLSPTTLAEVRVGYTRLGANVFPANFDSPPPGELLGIPNLPTDPQITGGWPFLEAVGFNRFGRTTSTPQFQIPNVYLYKGTVSTLKGAHSIKFGTDNMHIYTSILDVSALIGRFQFRSDSFSRNSWANFLLGMPNRISMTSPTVIYNQKRIHAFFLQDDYRVSQNLTLNLGLRYEYGRPITEKYDRLANFNPSTGERFFASDGSLADRALVEPDRNDISPRFGLAWTARPGFVIRGGYGIFYNHTNRQGREGLLGMNNPFVKDLERFQDDSTPAAELITLSSGPPADFLENASPSEQINRGNDPLLRNPYIQQWNLTLQMQPAADWLFEVGYVGNRGNKLTRFYDANQALTPGNSSTLRQRRPYADFGEIQYMDSGGTSNYHGLQTKIERRFSRGMSLLQAFSYSRALENVGAWGEEQSGGGRTPQNAYDFAGEYGLAGTNSKLRSVTNWVWQLPFGRGQRFLSNAHPAAEAIVGGWEFSGIWTWQSGLPVNIGASECSNCVMGGQRQQRADALSPSALDNPTAQMWFNTAAFGQPNSPFGTAGRNTVYGPGILNWDISLMKNFPFSETKRLQFRVEFFNSFNQVNYDRPNSNVSSSSFGRISTAMDGRSIQFGLKFYY